MVGEEEFRRVMGYFATGVTVVASLDREGGAVGLTVNAFTSVSLDPPLVLVCLHRDAYAHDPLLEAGHFGVSFLKEDQGALALRFSRDEPALRFRNLDLDEGPLGSPLLPGALAWVECEVSEVHPGGDHSIVVGRVVAGRSHEGEPLVFFRGALMGGDP